MINKMEFIQKLSIGDIVFLVVAIGIAEAVVFVFLIRYIKKPLKKLIEAYREQGVVFVISKLREKGNVFFIKHGYKNVEAGKQYSKKVINFNLFSKRLDVYEEYESSFVTIAFYPTGGMGDYIISAKILEEIQACCNCQIDVFVEKKVFGEAIYGGRKKVKVVSAEDFYIEAIKYDLAVLVEHFVHIIGKKDDRLLQFAPNLYDKVKYIENNWNKLYVDISEQCWRERIQFERCKVLGLNRWTELRMGKAFNVENMRVTIPFNSLYKKDFMAVKFYGTRYVTINYGADAMKIGFKQLKLWPKEHIEAFVKSFKQRFENVNVIQLGGADAEKLAGIDFYVLGESIELTKYILRDSLCHVDCEGGLVHLATQLGTKCVVVFGPTPVHMYGYPQNVNLYSDKCNNCMGLHEDWAYTCYRGDGAPCMKEIDSDTVLKSVENVIYDDKERSEDVV